MSDNLEGLPIEELRKLLQASRQTLIQVEADLLAQEHRLPKLICNWWTGKERFPPGDPRRNACLSALIWYVVSPQTIAAGSLGIATAIGLWLSYSANQFLSKQNEIISAEMQANLRNRLIESLYQHAQPALGQGDERKYDLPSADLGMAEFSHRTRAEALQSFVELERRRLRDAPHPRINLTFALLDHVDASGFDLQAVDFAGASMIAVYLKHANLTRAMLHNAKLGGSLLTEADFSNADLTDSDLSGSVMIGANLSHANLTRANLSGCLLIDAKLDGTNINEADLSNVVLYDSSVSKDDAMVSESLINKHGWRVVERVIESGVKIRTVESKK